MISELLEAMESARGPLDQFADEIQNAGYFDRTDIRDDQQFAEYKRNKIDRDYQGIRGLINRFFGQLGLEPSYQSKMDTITGAEDYAHAGDVKFAAGSDAQKTRQQLQQLQAQMDSAVADENKSAFQRQREAIDAAYTQAVAAADSIANNKAFYTQGFKSQAEANAYAEHLERDAESIHTAEIYNLYRARYDEMQTGNEQLDVLKRLGAGDTQGAARAALESALNAEERKIDPNDTEPVKQFEQISAQSLANFDADAARQHDVGGASNLSDAVRKLDATTTKLDKALSNSKTLVIVKD